MIHGEHAILNLLYKEFAMSDLMLWRDDLFTRLDSLFSNFTTDKFFDKALLPTLKKSGYPRVNVSQDDNNTVIEATVPGLTKENVSVEWSDNILTIKNVNKNEREDKSRDYYIREIHQSSFSRSFDVPSETFNVSKIEANVENGLLKVVIPFAEPKPLPEVKKIAVS